MLNMFLFQGSFQIIECFFDTTPQSLSSLKMFLLLSFFFLFYFFLHMLFED